jgi:LPS sulfotransferase NodH
MDWDRRLLDPRNGPDHDLVGPPAPRAYCVASTPRTGSTLLCRLLWDTGRVGAPKEYLNPMQLRDWQVRLGGPVSGAFHRSLDGVRLGVVGRGWSRERVLLHLARVRARRSSGGWFGLKVHRHHWERWGAPVRVDRWLHITRQDRLDQAISWATALQTGAWASTQTSRRTPRYSRRQIEHLLTRIEADEAAWRQELGGQDVLRLRYRDLAADPQATLGRAMAWLGVDDWTMPALPLRRQASPHRAAWAERFRAGR